jgi:hypothetical protein
MFSVIDVSAEEDMRLTTLCWTRGEAPGTLMDKMQKSPGDGEASLVGMVVGRDAHMHTASSRAHGLFDEARTAEQTRR